MADSSSELMAVNIETVRGMSESNRNSLEQHVRDCSEKSERMAGEMTAMKSDTASLKEDVSEVKQDVTEIKEVMKEAVGMWKSLKRLLYIGGLLLLGAGAAGNDELYAILRELVQGLL